MEFVQIDRWMDGSFCEMNGLSSSIRKLIHGVLIWINGFKANIERRIYMIKSSCHI